MQHYLECVSNIERLHRLFLEVLKTELDAMRVRDISNVQCLILYSIAGDEISVGELTERSYLLGSNVSYNLKKLVDAGYIRHERSAVDWRSVRVSLTESGHAVCAHLNKLFDRQGSSLNPVGGVDVDQLPGINTALARIERFWADHIRFRM